MQDSVFTKIIKGEIPCYKIYEDDNTIAFMDIRPLIEGHIVVVPKIQVDDFEKLPDAAYQALFDTVKKVAARAKQVFGVRKSIVMIEGFEVPHAHVHILPSDTSEKFYVGIERRNERPNEPDHAKLAEIAEKLRF